MYKNKGDLSFEKVNEQWGLKHEGFSNGAAYGDLDNDGDLDLVINNIDETSIIFENQTSRIDKSHYLKIKFKDESQNNRGIGSKITVITGSTRQLLELNPSRGFQSFMEPVLHVGLGNNKVVDSLIIDWIGGIKKVMINVAVDQELELTRKDGTDYNPAKNDFQPLFVENKKVVDSTRWHFENYYNDYAVQVLLPHKMSTFGPAIAVGDVNGDGLDDFFVGNGTKYAPSLHIQTSQGKFEESLASFWQSEAMYEDLHAEFIDVDGDNDLDLYVVSGGYEFKAPSQHLQDRLYLNESGVFSKAKNALPAIVGSGSKVIPHDYDGDGDVDLFVGGRLQPHEYPSPGISYLLVNQFAETGKVSFLDKTDEVAPGLKSVGMVTDAIWTDYNGNGTSDLVVVGEWMPISIFTQKDGQFTNETDYYGMADSNGWWFSIDQGDFDGDGDMDLVVGNLGLNYKYQATEDETFDLFYYDFDQNGSKDIVLGYYNFGEQYPLRGRQCSSQQIAAIQLKFEDYESFAGATITDVYGETDLEHSMHFQVSSFSSIVLNNAGNGQFKRSNLPAIAQIAPINDMIIQDFDEDGHLDLFIGGNLHASEVETPRADAGIGRLLKGNGKGGFKAMTMSESGINLGWDLKQLEAISINGSPSVIVGNNQGPVQFYSVNPNYDNNNIALVE